MVVEYDETGTGDDNRRLKKENVDLIQAELLIGATKQN